MDKAAIKKWGTLLLLAAGGRHHLPASVYKRNILSPDSVSYGTDKRTDGSSLIRICNHGYTFLFYRRSNC